MACVNGDDFLHNFSVGNEVTCLLYDLTMQYLSKGTSYKLPCVKKSKDVKHSLDAMMKIKAA
jgi:hypothetical protein